MFGSGKSFMTAVPSGLIMDSRNDVPGEGNPVGAVGELRAGFDK